MTRRPEDVQDVACRPSDPVATGLRLAAELLRRGDRARATDAYLRVAEIYGQAARPLEAQAVAFRALQLDSSRFVRVAVSGLVASVGAAALGLCRRAAEIHVAARRTHDALGIVELITELTPRCSRTWYQLARLYIRAGRHDEAIDALLRAAEIYDSEGNNSGFIRAMRAVLELDARHRLALRGLAAALLKVGEPERALATVSTLLQLKPNDPIGLETLARALCQLGKPANALSILTQLAQTLRSHGASVQAQSVLARARRWCPRDPAFAKALAAILSAPIRPPPIPVRTPNDFAGHGQPTRLMGRGCSDFDEESPTQLAKRPTIPAEAGVIELRAVDLIPMPPPA